VLFVLGSQQAYTQHMSGKNSLAILFILALLGGGGYVVYQTTNTASRDITQEEGEQNIPAEHLVEVPLLTEQTIIRSSKEERYTINVRYPEITLVANPTLANDANAVILSFVNDRIERFATQRDELASPLVPESFSSDLTISWKALLISPSIISLRFDSSEYIAGMAHPNNETRILNYNMDMHLLLPTETLFASSSRALPFLSEISRAALRMIMAEEPDEIFATQTLPGTEPRHENFQEVGITDKGLLVVFNPYQVAPYARGMIEVLIPLASSTESESGVSLLSPDVTTAIKEATTNFQEAVAGE
jgi:hypothetical protein